MAGSVNMPGILALGDLATTTTVSIGRGGALVVDNSGTGTAGQVTVAGSLSTGGLSAGSNPMTCGALSASSVAIASGGRISCDVGSATAPALCFGADSATGLYLASAGTIGVASAGVEFLRVGDTVSVYAPLSAVGRSLTSGALTCGALSSSSVAASGTVSCGAVTCGALSSGAIATAGALTCGASALTCGALSCASIASAGDVTQPRYAIRVTKNSGQSIATDTVTAVIWNITETTGGGATNWPFTANSTILTCPKSGKYCLALNIAIINVSGTCMAWVEINPPGDVPGSSRRYAEASAPANGGGANWVYGGSFTYQLSAGDKVLAAVIQSSGSNRNVGLSGFAQSEFSITRLSE
jgi:hypothetical protein